MSRTKKQCFVLNYVFKTPVFNREKESGTFLLTERKKFWQHIPYCVWELWLWNSEFVFLTVKMQKPASHISMWYLIVSLSFISAWVNVIQLSFRNTNILNNYGTSELMFWNNQGYTPGMGYFIDPAHESALVTDNNQFDLFPWAWCSGSSCLSSLLGNFMGILWLISKSFSPNLPSCGAGCSFVPPLDVSGHWSL